MEDKFELLVPEGTYHIYNRANGNELIFLSEENYRFFLMQFRFYILPVAEIYCYCLMPNHFHFLIRIKSEREIDLVLKGGKKYDYSKFVGKQFSNLFSSYTQAFNKQQRRMGSLFMKNFKRKKTGDDNYFRNLVYYIHYNPVEARLSQNPEDYKHSSYNAIISGDKVFTLREEVLSFFDGLDNFISFHKDKDNFGKAIAEGL